MYDPQTPTQVSRIVLAWVSEACAPSQSSLYLHQTTSFFTCIYMIRIVFSKSVTMKWTLNLWLMSSLLNCIQGCRPQAQNELKGLADHFPMMYVKTVRECQMLPKK